MYNFKQHLILSDISLSKALVHLEELTNDKILFVVDQQNKLLGSITDGDIRRGLLKNNSMDTTIEGIYESSPKFFFADKMYLNQLKEIKAEGIRVIPIVDQQKRIVDIFSYNFYKSYLPVDVVIMAGGRGSRLSPLTDSIPKPLLKIGQKPIMEHNMDRLVKYGIKNFWFSINYLKKQIKNHFKSGYESIKIKYVEEDKPLGTIGAVSKIENFKNDHILVTNSDILTNLDYEDFYFNFLEKDADIAMVTIPYKYVVPYGVVEIKDNCVKKITEKPSYTHYSNAGIYLMKKEIFKYIPKDQFFNATDLIEKSIANDKNVISYPFSGYWLDIGKPEDFNRAKVEINTVKF